MLRQLSLQGGAPHSTSLVGRLLRAVWVENRNIAEDDVIRDALAQAGFEVDELQTFDLDGDPALVNFTYQGTATVA